MQIERRDDALASRAALALGIVSAGLDSLVTATSGWSWSPDGYVKIWGDRTAFGSSYQFASRINGMVDGGGMVDGLKWQKRRELLLKGCMDFMVANHPDLVLTRQLMECPAPEFEQLRRGFA